MCEITGSAYRWGLAAVTAVTLQACSGGGDVSQEARRQTDTSAGVPIYDNLGKHGHPTSTASEEAQAYFDQGLRLQYTFNHAEAGMRSTRPGRTPTWSSSPPGSKTGPSS